MCTKGHARLFSHWVIFWIRFLKALEYGAMKMSKNWDSERKEDGFPEPDRACVGLDSPVHALWYCPPHSLSASYPTTTLPTYHPLRPEMDTLSPSSRKFFLVILPLTNSWSFFKSQFICHSLGLFPLSPSLLFSPSWWLEYSCDIGVRAATLDDKVEVKAVGERTVR